MRGIVKVVEKATGFFNNLLEGYGYRVLMAKDGPAAIAVAQSETLFDLVLMDIDLGAGIDGAETARRILASRELPVVFISAHTEPDIFARGAQLPAYGFIPKGSSDAIIQASLQLAWRLFSAQHAAGAVDRAQFYLDMAGVILWALDMDGRISLINQRGCAILGIDQATALGQNWVDSYVPADQADAVRAVLRRIHSGELDPAEFHENQIRTTCGDLRTIAWHNNVLRDQQGHITGCFCSGEDITDRKLAEQALRSSESRQRFLLDHMSQGVVYHGRDGKIVYANPAAAAILGLSLEQLYGTTSLDPRWQSIHEDGSPYPGNTHPAMLVLQTGQPVRNAVMGVLDPGRNEYRWININAFPMQADDHAPDPPAGRLELVMVTIEDFSQRRLYEAGLERQLQEKTILLKETHHRIKNNIATIGSLLSLQAGDSDDPAVSAALQQALSRLASMQELYKKMMVADDMRFLKAGDYLSDLANAVLQLFGASGRVELVMEFDPVELGAKQLFPLGSIINELMTNVLNRVLKNADAAFQHFKSRYNYAA